VDIEKIKRQLQTLWEQVQANERLLLKHAKRHDAQTAADPLTITSSAHAQLHALQSATDHSGVISSTQHGTLASGDLHTEYQKESERGAASGYCPLDAASDVPIANIPDPLELTVIRGNLLAMAETATELTIASGAITVGSTSVITLDTEVGAASDDLDSITGSAEATAQWLLIGMTNAAHNVVLKHGTGGAATKIQCPGGKDITLDTITDWALLFYFGNWIVVGYRTAAMDAELAAHEAAADPHTGYVLESIFAAKGDLLSASANDTPLILTVGADDTMLMADAAAASGLKWVASAAGGNIDGVQAAATGTADTFARSDHAHRIQHAITDNALVTIDDSPNDNEFAKFTANGIEGRTYAETRTDIGVIFERSITVEDPTSSEDLSIFFTNRAITITEIRAVLVGSSTPSVTWTVRHGTDRSAAGAEAVTGGTTTTSVSTGSDVTAFNDATIVADSFVWLETTAKSGTVDELHVTVIGTVD
jgi:hypothetical protein